MKNRIGPGTAGKAQDVNIQDQTTPPLIVPMNRVLNTTVLTTAAVMDERTVIVDDTTGFVDGIFIVLADAASDRFMIARQVGPVAGNTVPLDTPLDFAFPIGTQITNGSTGLNVDGSSTPVIFSLRASDPGLPLTVDVTRLIFVCVTETAVDLTKFGDLPVLLNGIVLRRVDGSITNIFNVKSNAQIASLMYDFTVHSATNPQQGEDGFISRLTFAGQNKLGVAVRIGQGEDLQLLVQDDLTDLVGFGIQVEGHVVDF